MERLNPGDKLVCHVKDMELISPYAEHSEQIILEVLASDSYGYFVYVPDYINLKKSHKLSKSNIKALGINLKFAESLILYVPDAMVAKVHSRLDGKCCTKCQEFFYQAEPNQEDGTMICWNCRNYKFYK